MVGDVLWRDREEKYQREWRRGQPSVNIVVTDFVMNHTSPVYCTLCASYSLKVVRKLQTHRGDEIETRLGDS